MIVTLTGAGSVPALDTSIITIERNVLVRALSQLAGVTLFRAKEPIDECIAVHGDADRLRLRVARSGFWLLLDLPAAGEFAETWINARALLDCVRAFKGEILISRLTKSRLAVEQGADRFELHTMDATVRPMPDPLVSDARLLVAAADLRALFDRVGPYIAPEDNRYGLNGMSWEFADGRLLGVGTDGYRLGMARVGASGALGIPKGAIVSAYAIRAIQSLSLAGDVAITFAMTMGVRPNRVTKEDEPYTSGAMMRVEWAGGVLHARLVLAEFPDWRRVIPEAFPNAITVDRDALVTAVRRGGKMCRDSSRSMRVTPKDGALTFASRSLTIGTAQASVPAGLAGAAPVFGLNRDFLLASLRTMPAGPVVIEPTAPLGPCRLRSLVDPSIEAIVMPVRLD
jgi:DNA polymerase-3 subunit beta